MFWVATLPKFWIIFKLKESFSWHCWCQGLTKFVFTKHKSYYLHSSFYLEQMKNLYEEVWFNCQCEGMCVCVCVCVCPCACVHVILNLTSHVVTFL